MIELVLGDTRTIYLNWKYTLRLEYLNTGVPTTRFRVVLHPSGIWDAIGWKQSTWEEDRDSLYLETTILHGPPKRPLPSPN